MTNNVDENREKARERVGLLTEDEFNREWERLFPLEHGDLPASLKAQAD